MRAKWTDFSQRLGLDGGFSEGVWSLLYNLYQIPTRHYHTLDWHIKHMLKGFYEFKKLYPGYTELWDEIEWAIWFHDIYCDPKVLDGKNELTSARLACELTCAHTKLNKNKVYSMIITTTHNLLGYVDANPINMIPESKLICDLDLLGFVDDDHRFKESEVRLQKEYSFISEEEYEKGRKIFLKKLLDRGYIFLTKEFLPYEDRTRNRIESLIKGKEKMEFIKEEGWPQVVGRESTVTFTIQNGPIREVGVNGCQIDDVIKWIRGKLKEFNSKYSCKENFHTINSLNEALMWLSERTKDRKKRAVEGLNKE